MIPASPAERTITTIELARHGRFDDIRDLFLDQLRPMVSADVLRAAWDTEISRLGPVISVGAPVAEAGPQHAVVVKVPVTCEHGAMTVVASLSSTGQLMGIQLAPPSAAEPTGSWAPPDYAAPEQFDEQEVLVGPGPLAVPGTITRPRAARPRPGIVLLAGSGQMTGTAR